MSRKRTRSTDLSNGDSHDLQDQRNVKQKLPDACSSSSMTNDLITDKITPLNIPAPGSKLPDFVYPAIMDLHVRTVTRVQFEGAWLCIVFYPLDFTDSKHTIAAYSDKRAQFESEDCQVVFCSTDSHYSHLAWAESLVKEQPGLHLPALLADTSHGFTAALGLLDPTTGTARDSFLVVDPAMTVRQVVVSDRHVDIGVMLATLKRHRTTDA